MNDPGLPTGSDVPGRAPLKPASLRVLLTAGLAALLALLVLVTVAILVRGGETPVVSKLLPRHSATGSEQQTLQFGAAEQAASAWTIKFMTVNYKTMDPLITAVLDASTDPFKTQYDRSKVNLKALVQDNLTISTGKVKAVGVSELTGDQAVVFVAADGTVTNKSTKGKASARYYRLKLTMLHRGDKWLTSQVEFVG